MIRGEGAYGFCDLSCKAGGACPGGMVPWAPVPCTLSEADALEALEPGVSFEADYVRGRRADLQV